MSRQVTAVVVTWNSRKLMPQLVRTLDALRPVLAGAVISDNASTDGTPDLVRSQLPWVLLAENPVNGGFGYGCNRGVDLADSPFVLFLNADARLLPGDLESLEKRLASSPGTAAVQPLIRLWDWPMVTLSAGVAMTRMGEGYDMDFMRFQPFPDRSTVEVPAVTAAVSLFRRSALERVSGFDEGIFMYFEDLDLCLRLREAGFGFLLDPSCTAEHMLGSSSSRSSALEWELESSAVISRRFLGGPRCKLPAAWKRREFRTRLALLRRGRGIGWRVRAVRSARRRELDHMKLAGEDLSFMVFPRPMREPGIRPPSLPADPLDREGMILRGPGWDLLGVASCGFGCLSLPGRSGTLELIFRRVGPPGSVALWLDGGMAARKLLSGPETSQLEVQVHDDVTRAYLVPDRREMGVTLESCRLIHDPRQ